VYAKMSLFGDVSYLREAGCAALSLRGLWASLLLSLRASARGEMGVRFLHGGLVGDDDAYGAACGGGALVQRRDVVSEDRRCLWLQVSVREG
jgi:hypothetical protein